MKLSVVTMAVVIAANLVLCGCKEEITSQTQVGVAAPDFTLKAFDGNEISLSDYKGKIVVLEWFNYECPFSRYHYEKSNTMIDLANKYRNSYVTWLAINSSDLSTEEKNKEFSETYKLPYPILDDRDGKIGRAYGAKTTPHMFIVNTAGVIVYSGAIDNAPLGNADGEIVNYVDKALEELTTNTKVSISQTQPYGCTVKYAD
jgi:peroxiredoxin